MEISKKKMDFAGKYSCENYIHLKAVGYGNKISKYSEIQNVIAAVSLSIEESFLGILKILETLV